MAADSNMGFHYGVLPSPSMVQNRHMLSFQSGTINSTTGLPSGGIGSSGELIITAGMFRSGNSGMMNNASPVVQAGTSSGSTYLERKHDSVLTPEWTAEEQKILNEGLVEYASVHGVMKYIKIASKLRRKTVRDVALRCRWMAQNESTKRRKLEEHCAGKKMKDRKEKLVDAFSRASLHMAPQDNSTSYSSVMHHSTQNSRFFSEALDGATHQLMEENAGILGQISSNLELFKIQENVDLLCRTRNNIVTVLNNMSNMPGIMSQMPPLPVSVNDELLNAVLPFTSQALAFGAPGGIHLEQQPRCNHL